MQRSCQKKLSKITRILFSGMFLFYCVVPHNFAFAQNKDCGPHQINPCGEHSNTHFVLEHEEEGQNINDVATEQDSNSSHDREHQVEEKSPYYNSANNSFVLDLFDVDFVAKLETQTLIPVSTQAQQRMFSRDPPGRSYTLLSLKTVRLQV